MGRWMGRCVWRHALALLALVALPIAASDVRPGELAQRRYDPSLLLRLRGGSEVAAEPRWWGGGVEGMRKQLDSVVSQIGGKQAVEVAPKQIDTVFDFININATPEEVFRVATNFPDYPKWAAAIDSVSIVQDGNPPAIVDLRMGMFGITLNNRFKYTYARPGKVDWYAAEGSSVRELVGAYRFKPAGAGATRAEYSLLVDPGFPLPRSIRNVTPAPALPS